MKLLDTQPHLTFRGNRGVARHGWLRLTPAYGVRLVDQELAARPDASVVLDPFSGTGTTGLCAATAGRKAHLIDLNPFLIWLATTKTRHYSQADALAAVDLSERITDRALKLWHNDQLWEPPLSNITRWWSPSALSALRALRAACDEMKAGGAASDLMEVALCQTLIDSSTAAFNHQSMSFKDAAHDHLFARTASVKAVVADFARRALRLAEECQPNPSGSVVVHNGEARMLASSVLEPVDLIITSPPYCNRMSYIREVRPYMYWLRFIDSARDAGELDWRAIGGTWGVATSRLLTEDLGPEPPLGKDFPATIQRIARTPDQPNARLLSNYVFKYFSDMWLHFRSTWDLVTPGGELVYIVGNSTFFGHVVPTEQWYADLLREAGYSEVRVDTIRKRNSNKLLFEFAVRARKS